MSMFRRSLLTLSAALAVGPAWAHGDAHDRPAAPAAAGMEMHPHEHGHIHAAGVHGMGFGEPGDPKRVSRTIEVLMDDAMRFDPAEIAVRAGETVRLSVRNPGKLAHELVIGPIAELQAHAEMMRRMPQMAHSEPNMTSLEAGQHGDIVWRFETPGAVDFACLIPGHLEAGMRGRIVVTE